jgi:hypothetical protein
MARRAAAVQKRGFVTKITAAAVDRAKTPANLPGLPRACRSVSLRERFFEPHTLTPIVVSLPALVGPISVRFGRAAFP